MKKQILVFLFALAALASTAQGMQEPLQVSRAFNTFSVDCQYFDLEGLDNAFKELDETLKLEKPVREKAPYSVTDMLKGALNVKNLSITSIGNNKYGSALLKMLQRTYIDDEGNIDFYNAVHSMREDHTYLSPLLTGLPGLEAPKDKKIDPVQASTSRFSWIKPTITYTGLFFGGMAVLKAWQLYKNR